MLARDKEQDEVAQPVSIVKATNLGVPMTEHGAMGTSFNDHDAIRKELGEAGILRIAGDSELLLQEAKCLLAPLKHEGRVVGYGMLSGAKVSKPAGAILVPPRAGLEESRYLADGINTFTVLESGHFAGTLFLPSPLREEADLVQFRESTGADVVAVVRTNAETTFYTRDGVAIQHNRRWHFKPAIAIPLAALVEHASVVDRDIAGALLSFCSHILSPQKIGATIVWEIVPLPPQAKETARPQVAVADLPFDFRKGHGMHALASMLAARDGATIVSSHGKVLGLGIQLSVSDLSRRFVKPASGTRHTSARRFSFDRPEVVVITVSSDGPVSIFSDGALISHVQFGTSAFPTPLYTFVNEERGGDVEWSVCEVMCKQCNKTYEVRNVFIPGWRGDETVTCVVCEAIVMSDMTFDLCARLVKVLP